MYSIKYYIEYEVNIQYVTPEKFKYHYSIPYYIGEILNIKKNKDCLENFLRQYKYLNNPTVIKNDIMVDTSRFRFFDLTIGNFFKGKTPDYTVISLINNDVAEAIIKTWNNQPEGNYIKLEDYCLMEDFRINYKKYIDNAKIYKLVR